MQIDSGDVSRKVPYIVEDPSTGDLLTGQTLDSAYYSLDGGALTEIVTPTITESSATNAPGLYWLALTAGTTLPAGVNSAILVIYLKTDGGITLPPIQVDIVRPVITAGQTLSVASGALGANTITNTSVADGAISVTKLADNTITNAKVADGAITAPKLHADALSTQNSIGKSTDGGAALGPLTGANLTQMKAKTDGSIQLETEYQWVTNDGDFDQKSRDTTIKAIP